MTTAGLLPSEHTPQQRPARNFRAALAALGSAQKKGAGVPAYTRWVNRRLGRLAAAAAYSLGLGPNAVTVLSAAVSAVGIALLIALPVSPLLGVAVAVLFAAGYALDSADGQVARLSGTGSIAGEWLDHVVDAIRTPAQHLAVLAALWLHTSLGAWALIVAAAYCIVGVGQFMSQILAEQLSGRVHRDQGGAGKIKSFVLLPTDTGVFCWLFLLWGAPVVFAIGYTVLFVINTVHALVSMRRKYQHLSHLTGASA